VELQSTPHQLSPASPMPIKPCTMLLFIHKTYKAFHMNTATSVVRTSQDVKQKAQQVFKGLGLDMSTDEQSAVP
jgi:hypothetical protein